MTTPPLLQIAEGRRARPRKPPAQRQSELRLHIDVVEILRRFGRQDWLWWHTPNGEIRDPRAAAKLKAMGVRPGVPDLLLVGPDGLLRFLELKASGGRLSEEQETFRAFCITRGLPFVVAFSLDEALVAFKTWECPHASNRNRGMIDPATTGNADTPDLLEGYDGDSRLLGLNLNDVEKTHASCAPLVLNTGLYAKLFALAGGQGVDGAGGFDSLVHEVVVFLPGGRFEFARDLRDATGAKAAVIIPARDEDFEHVDLVALDLETSAIATWLGRVAVLGQEWLAAATLDEPLMVHETPLDWLRAGREGLYVVDAGRAARLLAGRSIAVKDVAHGVELCAALRLSR